MAFLASLSASIAAQEGFSRQGAEYDIIGAIPGDQTHAQVAVGPNGGYVVWQDNYTDGDGLGIGARRLDGSFSGALSTFRVNEQAAGDQEDAQVAVTADGGAIFVWQGGVNGSTKIFARIVKPDGTFLTGDVQVNTFSNGMQVGPKVAALKDGSFAVVWTSFNQDGSQQGVYGQRLSSTGEKLGAEFPVNVTTTLGQRSPDIAALSDGGFVVAWVSEAKKSVVQSTDDTGVVPDNTSGALTYDIGIFASIYDASGTAVKREFRADDGSRLCGTPAVAASGSGFTVVWSAKNATPVVVNRRQASLEGWDVWGRAFSLAGEAASAGGRLNTFTYGDQFAPKIAGLRTSQMVVWTSLNQDGSGEGVFGRVINASDAQPMGDEIPVNASTRGPQRHPAIASDGVDRFVSVWSSYVGGINSFDLFAQRYSYTDSMPTPGKPFVAALSQSRLSVTWPALAGVAGVSYDVYLDGSAQAVTTTDNSYTFSSLTPGSTHSFRLAYSLASGQHSPLSEEATGKTWGEDENFDGLPDDWQSTYWGANSAKWPAANVDSDGDGASNLQEFMAGTNPADASSVLKTRLIRTGQGRRLEWNTQPGYIYQVQSTTTLKSWSNLDGPRFAAGTTDSIPVPGAGVVAYYRVIRLR